MTKPKQFLETSESEEYLHKYAWAVVKRQIQLAENESRGALYDDLVAMVFAFHSLEGYVNFVGEKVAPDLWRDERRRFKSDIFKKLKAILERCEMEPLDKSRRPYSTIKALQKLRNKMTHPKTHRSTTTKKFREGKEPELFQQSHLETLVCHEKALRARDDVSCIADLIHRAASDRFRNAGLGAGPFDGVTSMRSSSMSLLSDDE